MYFFLVLIPVSTRGPGDLHLVKKSEADYCCATTESDDDAVKSVNKLLTGKVKTERLKILSSSQVNKEV